MRWKLAAERGEMPWPDELEKMQMWELSPGMKPPGLRRKCTELRRTKPGAWGSVTPGGAAAGANPDWMDFTASFPDQASPDQLKQIQNLERQLHFLDFALGKARERGDSHLTKVYTEDLIKFSRAIKEQKALADKLGVESGELLQRPEIERIIAALGYWSMAAIDAVLPTLCKRLVGVTAPSEVRKILEPALLRAKFLEPFVRAKTVANGNALPPWIAAKIVDSADDYLQGGKELMAATPTNDSPKIHP